MNKYLDFIKKNADNLNMKKFCSFLIVWTFLTFNLFSLDLSVKASDIIVEKDEKAGYHLYIKQKDGVNSVLLTETSKDPENKTANYAYRSENWNKINGDEKRILDGNFLDSEFSKNSIVDSTVENHETLGKVFHLYLPEKLIFGYPWTRNGEVKIEKGTFVSIRTFEKPYADYSGEYLDNPFMFNFITRKKEKEIIKQENYEVYNPLALDSFKEIATEGSITYSQGPESLVDDILKSFKEINPKDRVDVVFAIDATGSMKNDVDHLRQNLIPQLEAELLNFGSVRLGLLLYRDYGDNYVYNGLPIKFFNFTDICDEFYKNLNDFKIRGNEGGDVPEAVYEALYGALEFYNWDSKAQKKIILIGDAEPHKRPRGSIKCTKEMVLEIANKKNVLIDTIIIPED